MWMTINKCARGTTGLCRDNEQKFVEAMHCERFDGDQEGPWYMISQATEHETCGAAKVSQILRILPILSYNYFQNKITKKIASRENSIYREPQCALRTSIRT